MLVDHDLCERLDIDLTLEKRGKEINSKYIEQGYRNVFVVTIGELQMTCLYAPKHATSRPTLHNSMLQVSPHNRLQQEPQSNSNEHSPNGP